MPRVLHIVVVFPCGLLPCVVITYALASIESRSIARRLQCAHRGRETYTYSLSIDNDKLTDEKQIGTVHGLPPLLT
jgi:hypothetical protein